MIHLVSQRPSRALAALTCAVWLLVCGSLGTAQERPEPETGFRVPAIAFNTYFRNRITQLTLEVGHVADDLLTQMYHNSKKPGVPTSPATAMPAAPAVAAATPVAAAPVAPPGREGVRG